MYEDFFGLRERPFDLTPNPRYLLLTPKHREALSNLEFGIASRKGVVVLIGEAGTGKTTIARTLIEKQNGEQVKCVYLNNPALTRSEFVQFLAQAFSLGTDAESSKTVLLSDLVKRIEELRAGGMHVALLVDEAQSLPFDLLEEIRLLTNIETTEEKLLTVILTGQPELADRLNDDSLRQLKQRIELRCTLGSLDLQETAAYIARRIRTAGGESARIFTREAVQLIHERSRGIPRSISVICENALIGGFAANERPVTRRVVQEVCDDFDLRARAEGSSANTGKSIHVPQEHESPLSAPFASPAEKPAYDTNVAAAGQSGGRRWRLFS
jgi:general secretion pathway protein A